MASVSTSDGRVSPDGKVEIVTVRNWLRRHSFSVCMPYSTDVTASSGTFSEPRDE